MNVAIIGGNPYHLNILDKEMMKLIEESGRYLFNVIGGYVGEYGGDLTLGQVWAKYRGLPYYTQEYKDLNLLMHGVTAAADYIIFMNDGSQIIKRFIMVYKQSGKHGSVINING